MSADNWTYCPKCRQDETARRAKKRKDLEDSYGKIPSDSFVRSVRALEIDEERDFEQTLREDYTIGVFSEDMTFAVSYEAGCRICGWTYSYKKDEPITVQPEQKRKGRGKS